jgi:hypothetical protein
MQIHKIINRIQKKDNPFPKHLLVYIRDMVINVIKIMHPKFQQFQLCVVKKNL